MSEIKYGEYYINDLFEYVSGNIGYNKSYCNAHKGDFPVYTATIKVPAGYIDHYEYIGPCLSWTVDGINSGTVEILEGKFSTGNGRGLLIPKIKGIHLKYLKYILEPVLKEEALRHGRGGTLHCKWSHIRNKSVRLPVLRKGIPDYATQRETAEKYDGIEEQKQVLLAKVKELEEISVVLPQEKTMMQKKLKEIFVSVVKGKSKYTKTFCRENAGEYPVYSADNEKPLGWMKYYDYAGEYLTISINGIAGNIRILNGCFSANADRVVCVPEEGIDMKYVKYAAEPVLRRNAKGRRGDFSKNEFTKLTPDMIKEQSIPLPLREDGTYDMEKQREFADKYEQLEKIKNSLIHRIIELTDIVVVSDDICAVRSLKE